MPYSDYIHTSDNLVTPYEQVRAGFLKIALEKNRYATPYVAEAMALKAAAGKATVPQELVEMSEIKTAVLAASGISNKALGHLTESDQKEAVSNLIENFLSPAGSAFVDELVFRFLLTKGDSLGGKMRNLAGKLAEHQFIRTIVATLSIQGQEFRWYDADARKWLCGKSDNPDIAFKAKGLSWMSQQKSRTLLFNLTVPFVGKNIDLCLFDSAPEEIKRGRNTHSNHYHPNYYLALGELKGGIDPAGADEHWKTANSALSRIRTSFEERNHAPQLFFIGAAIAKSMASEIFEQLQTGQLTNAANLTDNNQLFSLSGWLISL